MEMRGVRSRRRAATSAAAAAAAGAGRASRTAGVRGGSTNSAAPQLRLHPAEAEAAAEDAASPLTPLAGTSLPITPTMSTGYPRPSESGSAGAAEEHFCAYWPRRGTVVVVGNGSSSDNDDGKTFDIIDGHILQQYWTKVQRVDPTNPPRWPNPLRPIPHYDFTPEAVAAVQQKVDASDGGMAELDATLRASVGVDGFLCSASTAPVGLTEGYRTFASRKECRTWPPTVPHTEATTLVAIENTDNAGRTFHFVYETQALQALWDLAEMSKTLASSSCNGDGDSGHVGGDEDDDKEDDEDSMDEGEDHFEEKKQAPSYSDDDPERFINPLLLSKQTMFGPDIRAVVDDANTNVERHGVVLAIDDAVERAVVWSGVEELDRKIRTAIAWYYTGPINPNKDTNLNPNMGAEQLAEFHGIGDTILVCAHNIMEQLEEKGVLKFGGNADDLKRVLYYAVAAYRVALANVEAAEYLINYRSMFPVMAEYVIPRLNRMSRHNRRTSRFHWDPQHKEFMPTLKHVLDLLQWENPCRITGYPDASSTFA